MDNQNKEKRSVEKTESADSISAKKDLLESEKQIGKRKDIMRNAYHNTILLLQHYRNIAWALECFPTMIAEELETNFSDIDQLIDYFDSSMQNKKMEFRMESIKKTRLLIDRVNEALTILKRKPGNGNLLYQLIYLTYIDPEQLSHTEVIYRINISSRHYYRLRSQAIKIISIRLWAAPTKDVDLWLDMLSRLEGQD